MFIHSKFCIFSGPQYEYNLSAASRQLLYNRTLEKAAQKFFKHFLEDYFYGSFLYL